MTDYFSELEAHFQKEEYNAALKVCQKILEEQPQSVEAHKSRVYCLVNLSKWQELLALVGDNPSFASEKAYALYRLNRLEEAKAALKGLNSDFAERLEPQITYRMGEYDECVRYYKKLREKDPGDSGLAVNLLASTVSGDKCESGDLGPVAKDFIDSSYEVNFNIACGLLEAGLLEQAMEALDTAREILVADITEEDPDVDVETHTEVAVIDIQRAVVMQRLNRGEEAREIYDHVLKLNQQSGHDEVDVTALAVAANNLTSLRSARKNLFDSLKRINAASKESLAQKLTTKQTISIGVNKTLILLQANKITDAKEQVAALLKKAGDHHPKVKIAEASVYFAEKKEKKVEETLKSLKTAETVLALAQFYSQQEKYEEAMDALVSLPIVERSRPELLEPMCVLCVHKKGDTKLAVKLLQEAIAFVEKNVPDHFEIVLRVCMNWVARLNDKEFASSVYKQFLEQVDGADARALSGLAEYATDPEDASIYAKKLQVPSWAHIDAEELELAPVPKVQRKKKDDKDAKDEGVTAVKKSRKRKIRYPKNFDPENPGPPPDPERWLPKHERTEYKKKMAKKTKGLIRGPQGAMPTDDQAFRSKGPSTAQKEVATSEVKRKKKGRR